MKIRQGFVSNSSSASFVVKRHYISDHMMDKIYDHKDIAGKDAWKINVEKYDIIFSTDMDNFDMMEYLIKIGVPKEAIKDVEEDY